MTNKKRSILISAGMGHVGQALVRECVKRGYFPIFFYRESNHDIDLFKKEFGDKCLALPVRFFEEKTVTLLLENLFSTYQIVAAVDTLGGPLKRSSLLTIESSEVDTMGKLFSPSFLFLTSCARLFKAKKSGVLIGITTIGILKREATKSMGMYVPLKFALQGLLTSLKEELLPYGVRVYSVAPGLMMGGQNRNFPKALFDIFIAKSETKLETTAEFVAEGVIDLCDGVKVSDDLTIPLAREYRV